MNLLLERANAGVSLASFVLQQIITEDSRTIGLHTPHLRTALCGMADKGLGISNSSGSEGGQTSYPFVTKLINYKQSTFACSIHSNEIMPQSR
jgi:hypothetical protein